MTAAMAAKPAVTLPHAGGRSKTYHVQSLKSPRAEFRSTFTAPGMKESSPQTFLEQEKHSPGYSSAFSKSLFAFAG